MAAGARWARRSGRYPASMMAVRHGADFLSACVGLFDFDYRYDHSRWPDAGDCSIGSKFSIRLDRTILGIASADNKSMVARLSSIVWSAGPSHAGKCFCANVMTTHAARCGLHCRCSAGHSCGTVRKGWRQAGAPLESAVAVRRHLGVAPAFFPGGSVRARRCGACTVIAPPQRPRCKPQTYAPPS
jgi:hypothetical protein